MHTVQPSFIREILKAASSPGILSMAGGLPREALFPADAFLAAVERVMREHGASALQYAATPGDLRLREWIADHLLREHGIPSVVEDLIITTGSQQGIDICGKLFSDGPVVMEEPGYLGAILAMQANRVPITPISTTPEGPDLPLLEEALASGARLFYGMSRFQNPRGASYSTEAAVKVAELLNRYDAWMVEDDPYGDLSFDETAAESTAAPPSPPVASIAPERVIYLGSFSKTIAPSLRLGFLRAPRELIRMVEPLKQAADLHSSGVLQQALSSLLTGGNFSYEDHIGRVRNAYRSGRDTLLEALSKKMPGARVPIIPQGGMFLWAKTGESTDLLFRRALKAGVAFVPGGHFYLSQPDDRTMRLNFTNLSPREIFDAIDRLATVQAEERAAAGPFRDT